MKKGTFIVAASLGFVASSALASIPRHAVLASSLAYETDALFQPSPRAPLLSQCSGISGQRSEISEADNASGTVQYRFDKAGAVTNIVYPGNFTVAYGWDTAGRLVSVKDWASREWTFNYDGGNRLTGIQYPNGVTAQRGYNADGLLTNLVYSAGSTPFISRSFERNAAGLKTREVISAGLEAEPGDTWQKHTSDKADRLTGLTRRDEYVVPENWRGYTPSYNQEGQVTNVTEGYRSWSSGNNLVWDDAGRLVEYTGLRQTNLWTDTPPLPSWGLELGYDGLGERTVRTDELVTHRLVVDRVGRLKVPLAETDAGNTPVRYFVWGPGIGLLAQIEANGTIRYFHADENGSTLAMTDASSNVSDQFAYSPWGELIGRTGTNTTAFTFVGGGGVTWEGGSLYRMGARYYDARLKRWLSSDPAGMAGGANLYLYCNGNPLMWVDLLGLCGQSIGSLMWDDIGQQFSAANNTIARWAGASLGPLVQSISDMMALPDRALDRVTGTTPESRMAWVASTPVPYDDMAMGTLGALSMIGGTLRMEGTVVKVIPELRISASKYPELAENIANAQNAGHPSVLTHGGNATINRATALQDVPNIRPWSRDEYPFASSLEGGGSSWVGHVPVAQQQAQGGLIRAMNLTPGDQYRVIIAP